MNTVGREAFEARIEAVPQRVNAMADSASNLKTHMWLTAATLSLGVIGTVVAAHYATQASHPGIAQTIISAVQQGQQAQIPLKQ